MNHGFNSSVFPHPAFTFLYGGRSSRIRQAIQLLITYDHWGPVAAPGPLATESLQSFIAPSWVGPNYSFICKCGMRPDGHPIYELQGWKQLEESGIWQVLGLACAYPIMIKNFIAS